MRLVGVTVYSPRRTTRLNVWVVEGLEDQILGMQYRDGFGPADGMLFIFEEDDWRAFHMRNVKIPLDILFFSRQGFLTKGYACVQPETTDHRGRGQFVLEMPCGSGERLGLWLHSTRLVLQ